MLACDMPFHSSGKQDFHSRCFKISSTGGKCINAKGKDTNQNASLALCFHINETTTTTTNKKTPPQEKTKQQKKPTHTKSPFYQKHLRIVYKQFCQTLTVLIEWISNCLSVCYSKIT